MTDARMEKVLFQEGYQLYILLDNGSKIIYNLEPKIMTARFQELADWEVFSTGQLVGGKRICWITGVELSLNEILLNINHTRV